MNDHPTDGSAALQPTGSAPSPRLVTLAILKSNWNDGRSYLDNFVPFVAQCLRDAPTPLDLKQVQTAMRVTFGMKIPQQPLETVLKRARSAGYVERSGGLYHPNREALAETTSPAQNDFLRCYKALVLQLQDFAGKRYGRELTDVAAAAALDGYVDDFGAPIVLRGAAAEREFDPAIVPEHDVSFIVHAFVEHLADTDPAGFKYLATVVEGSMLASVVYLPDVGSVTRKFKDSTTVYLDTPFLLRVLGHVGPELAAPANELLELLRDYGARVACFDKTASELRGVILAAGRSMGTGWAGGSSDVRAHFTQLGLRRADVDIIAAGLEAAMGQLGIAVLTTPPYSATSDVDEAELQELLEKEVRYHQEAPMRHDLDALTAVDRLRRSRHQPVLENCRAIFLTTNVPLVRVARRFFRVDGQDFNWPPAILDTDLATLLWLKKPLDRPDLPRKQIMADCYATLRPNPAVWDRWLEEIDRTAAAGAYSDAHLDYIRFSPDAQRVLMDLTMGDASVIEQDTVAEVVAAAEKHITGPVVEKLSVVEGELEVERALREAAQRDASDANMRATEEASTRKAIEEAFQLEREQRRRNLQDRAAARARTYGNVLFAVLLVTFVVSPVLAVVGLGGVPGPDVAVGWRIAAGVVWLVSSVVGVLATAWDMNARKLGRWVEGRLQPRLYRRYLRAAGEAFSDVG